MIFDIYEQSDLYDIAKCRRQATLTDWLHQNRIAYSRNAKGEIMVHRKVLEAGLGVKDPSPTPQKEVVLAFD